MRYFIILFIAAAQLGLAVPPGAFAQKAGAAEIEFWRTIKQSKDPAEYRAYLEAFPNGVFAPLAKIRMKRLEKASAAGLGGMPSGSGSAGGGAERSGARVGAPAGVPGAREKGGQAGLKPEAPETAPGGLAKPKAQSEHPPAGGAARTETVEVPDVPGNFGAIGARLTWLEAEAAEKAGLVKKAGARVDALLASYPAAKSDLEAGDFITAVDGKAFDYLVSLVNHIRMKPKGAVVKLEVHRDGKARIIEVPVGRMLGSPLKAAQAGDAAAMLKVAEIRFAGLVGQADPDAGRSWLSKAVAKAHAPALYLMGTLRERGRWGYDVNLFEALERYKQAAEKGSAKGALAVGRLLEKGLTGEAEPKAARKYYERAAEGGSVAARLRLGAMLSEGVGGPKDLKAAAAEFEVAITAGSPEGAFRLGRLHHGGGEGLKQDCAKVRELYEKALEGYEGGAAWGLGVLHLEGCGVSRDRAKAIAYFRRAAVQDYQAALDQLEGMGLTPFSPKEIQELLDELGYKAGPVDGHVGAATRGAIRKFQNDSKVPVTGVLSLALVKQLRKALADKQQAARQAGRKPAPALWRPEVVPSPGPSAGGRGNAGAGDGGARVGRRGGDSVLDGLMGR